MATATQSTTLMARPARAIVEGPTTVPFSILNLASGATASGATLIQLCKIPVGATITDVNAIVVSGAATNPMDIGITGTGVYLGAAAAGSASTFASAGAGAAVVRATKGLTWKVEASDDATTRFATLTATATPGTVTVSFALAGSVTYTMGEQ